MDTKALRQKILDIAIRGKLVPQDPNDEPASVLLERIRAEKQQMVKDGKLKAKDIKNDSVIFIGDDNCAYEKFPDGTVKCIQDEVPFELPEGWEWTRLGSLCFGIVAGKSIQCIERTPNNEELGIVKVSSVSWGIFQENESKTCIGDSCYKKDYIIRENDFLISRSNTTELVGSCVIVETINKKLMLSDKILRILFSKNVLNMYILIAMRSSICRNQIESKATGTSASMKNISQDAIKNILIPLPSSQEQYRIAAKYNELLNLIDTIESDKTDLQSAIQLTKSKILDLAIRGQLVPQDPTDEPASVLLDRIRAEKEELIKQGKIKRDKKESVIFRGDDNSYYEKVGDIVTCIDEELPFELPDGWSVARLKDICNMSAGKSLAKDQIKSIPFDGCYPCYGGNGRRGYVDTYNYDGKYGIIGRQGALCGNVNIADGKFYATEHAVVVTLYTGIDFLWSVYAMIALNLNQYATGAAQPGLSVANIMNVLVVVPPANEQMRISETIKRYSRILEDIEKSLS